MDRKYYYIAAVVAVGALLIVGPMLMNQLLFGILIGIVASGALAYVLWKRGDLNVASLGTVVSARGIDYIAVGAETGVGGDVKRTIIDLVDYYDWSIRQTAGTTDLVDLRQKISAALEGETFLLNLMADIEADATYHENIRLRAASTDIRGFVAFLATTAKTNYDAATFASNRYTNLKNDVEPLLELVDAMRKARITDATGKSDFVQTLLDNFEDRVAAEAGLGEKGSVIRLKLARIKTEAVAEARTSIASLDTARKAMEEQATTMANTLSSKLADAAAGTVAKLPEVIANMAKPAPTPRTDKPAGTDNRSNGNRGGNTRPANERPTQPATPPATGDAPAAAAPAAEEPATT